MSGTIYYSGSQLWAVSIVGSTALFLFHLMFLLIFFFFAKAKVLILFSTPVLYSALNVIACLEMSVISFIGNKCDKN